MMEQAGTCVLNPGRGLCGPCTPQQGHRPCTRNATNLTYSSFVFPHVSEENEKKQHHGRNENNQKRTGEKASFLLRLFLCFPRMLCIRWTAFRRRPVCGCAASNSQSYNLLLQRVFACFLEGRRQPLRPCGPAPFTQGSLFLLTSAGFSCFSGKMFA